MAHMTKAATGRVPDFRTGAPPADPEFLQAVVAVYRHLEFASQLRELATFGAEWLGASAAFGFGPAEDGKRWQLLGSSLEASDPRIGQVGCLSTVQVREFLPDAPVQVAGFGPVAPLFSDWETVEPAHVLIAPVYSPAGHRLGLVVFLLEQLPAEALVERVHALLDETRRAVGNAFHVATMQQLIIKDDTAHCFNRRYFEEFLPEELSRASRFRAPLSLIFLDMDGLRTVNKRFGHSRGSRSLLEVSVRIRAKIRKFDKLFRFGGDEFCIVLPETEWHGAAEVAERVRDAIAGQPFLVQEVGGEGRADVGLHGHCVLPTPRA